MILNNQNHDTSNTATPKTKVPAEPQRLGESTGGATAPTELVESELLAHQGRAPNLVESIVLGAPNLVESMVFWAPDLKGTVIVEQQKSWCSKPVLAL